MVCIDLRQDECRCGEVVGEKCRGCNFKLVSILPKYFDKISLQKSWQFFLNNFSANSPVYFVNSHNPLHNPLKTPETKWNLVTKKSPFHPPNPFFEILASTKISPLYSPNTPKAHPCFPQKHSTLLIIFTSKHRYTLRLANCTCLAFLLSE